MGFENNVDFVGGGGALYDVQRCNLFGARLHACSMRKNQRAWVERWALRTVWAWPWGGSMCGTLVGEHFMMYNKGATWFWARLHACSMRKNQRAWVQRWALTTVWAWPWGGSMCGTLVGEHFMMYNKGATWFGARLHACSMRKNQRAWVERWALRTVWAWPWGGSMCGTLVGEHFMMYSKGATCLGQGCMHVACGKIKGPGWNGGL